jgi:hypothetical protein
MGRDEVMLPKGIKSLCQVSGWSNWGHGYLEDADAYEERLRKGSGTNLKG